MPLYNVYQIDAFTKDLFKGNPAGVVSNADGLTESEMQAIARELNNAETAFILSPTASDHDVWIRFFTPTTEVPSCGHATIAAHYVRALEKDLSSCTVRQRIGIGILPVDIVKKLPGQISVVNSVIMVFSSAINALMHFINSVSLLLRSRLKSCSNSVLSISEKATGRLSRDPQTIFT